jgi:ribosomal protein S18 acetylase RimI-like enzyme
MPLTIRRALPEDAPIVVEFNQLLAQESEGKNLDASRLGLGVRAVLQDGAKGLYFLACEGPQVLGQIMVTFEWSDWRDGWFWWIQSVYVRSAARRRGVFRSLFDHVVREAKSREDVIGLRLYVERANEAAQKTYQAMGLEPTSYFVMERHPW